MFVKNTKKWGVNKNNKPKFSRFKLYVQYYNGAAAYFSYDFIKMFKNGNEIKVKNENVGFIKLLEFLTSLNKRERDWRYANLFANITNDLDTSKKNFDYLVLTATPSAWKWKKKLFWVEEIFPLYRKVFLDVEKTKKWNEEMLQYNEFSERLYHNE